MGMTPCKLDMAQGALEAWGRPQDIGAETLEGDVRVAGDFGAGAPETPVFGGLYTATFGRYRVVCPFHEHATLLEGELALTDETTGETQV